MRTRIPLGPFGAALLVLAGGCASAPHTPTAATAPTETLTLELGQRQTMTLVRIPAGAFLMGAPVDEPGRREHEGPQHLVTLARPFFLGRCEVTQAQWRAVLRENPSHQRGNDLPVTGISWDAAQEFCGSMSRMTGRKVRLPSEAEWEYACRAGTTTAYSFGNDPQQLGTYGWTAPDAPRSVSPVGRKQPNAWGLYDMHGNAWEWCADVFHPAYDGAPGDGSAWAGDGQGRVLRGGSWFSAPAEARCAARIRRPAHLRAAYVGLRVVVEIE